MAKAKTVYICQQCGSNYPRWAGQCGQCGAWNSLVEEVVEASSSADAVKNIDTSNFIISFPEVARQMPQKRRISTGIDELDRVLGGEGSVRGMVEGAVMLIGGEPGIGKSTLLTQLCLSLLESSTASAKKPIVYVCGEENPAQIAGRVERLLAADVASGMKKGGGVGDRLRFCTSTNVDVIVDLIKKEKPVVVIVDSIQTVTTTDLTGVAGSVGQVRESALRLSEVAKQTGVPLFMVGHVTKEGELAGPKVLEHMVDAVLELSGDRTGDLRLLRSVKNRFGATDEVGVFRLLDLGMVPVSNPSELFLEHVKDPVPGSVSCCVLEGTRPLVVEIQALVVRSNLAMPRRVTRGLDSARLQIITAVLQKYSRVPLEYQDVFVSLAGGYSSKDPGLDLGIALAIVSSYTNKTLPAASVCMGELGLLGEVREVSFGQRRTKEATRLGFEHIITKSKYKTITECIQKLHLVSEKKVKN